MNSSMRLQHATPVVVMFLLALLQLSHGQGFVAPSPAPQGPTSDGNTIDQGIAFVLMMVALAVTYIFH
ncbi:hypothetical protein AQUCO_02000205v1 [Aquilegia coerulea]|uniref:Uncharacterized protein n=1 Tax=Aquilegia coerulea TaxID=218851 RepID=A0A2G5DGF3_AQUCA|nr:hypothetical protein AQUCO_02000205v1 [Aquilegia coerulea]